MPTFPPLPGTLVQLALTLGLVTASFTLRVNILMPVIPFHALWDMVQFLGGLWVAELWWRGLRKRR